MKSAFVFLVFITALACACAQEPEARTALVIGVSNYSDHYFGKLEAPEMDARAMEANLKSLGFTVTLLLNPTRQEMNDATDAFGRTLADRNGNEEDPRGVGLFYFSGHGSAKPDEADPNFLIPAKTSISTREDLPQEAFNAQRVANRMKEAGNRLNLIFLDACRSNSLPSRSKDGAAGLAAMRGASGLMFFYATQPNQIALEDGEAKSSLFTQALLRHIRTPNLSFMDMMGDVTRDTEKLSQQYGGKFKQSPYMSGTLSGRFAFVPAGKSASALANHSAWIPSARPNTATLMDFNPRDVSYVMGVNFFHEQQAQSGFRLDGADFQEGMEDGKMGKSRLTEERKGLLGVLIFGQIMRKQEKTPSRDSNFSPDTVKDVNYYFGLQAGRKKSPGLQVESASVKEGIEAAKAGKFSLTSEQSKIAALLEAEAKKR